MSNRLLRTLLNLAAAALIAAWSAPSTVDSTVAGCPFGTHWDSATGTCK